MLERVLNTPLQLHLFNALYWKTHQGKLDQYQPVQWFLSKYPYVKHIHDSLQLSKKQTNLKINLLTKNVFKGTLMQIWKSLYMFVFIWKQYPESSAFLILRIL